MLYHKIVGVFSLSLGGLAIIGGLMDDESMSMLGGMLFLMAGVSVVKLAWRK